MIGNIVKPTEVRKSIIEILYKSKASHLGPSMSAVEMLIAMYSLVDIQKIISHSSDRSRIIVSKGHCSAATCATMHHFGIISKDLLNTYHQNDSKLSGHVSHGVKGIEHSTGSLGHGVSVSAGVALGLRVLGHQNSQVLTLCGDGELQEGSVWEALMFVKHKKISNFVVLVDNNKISSITDTHKVIDLRPLKNRFIGFGLAIEDIDGHNVDEIRESIKKLSKGNKPGIIICNTTKGKDIPFAENDPIWHYRILDEKLYEKAMNHLNGLSS